MTKRDLPKVKKMKFNILYFLFPAALAACYWIALDFQGQSTNSFFGIAETEPQTLNFDRDIAVREVRVRVGDLVKKGDTLAIFARADLDKTETERRSDIRQNDTERAAEHSIFEKEKQVVAARQQAKIGELRTQIRVLRTEDSLKTIFRKSIYDNLPAAPENRVVAAEIAALEKEIAQLETETREEIRLLDTRQTANQSLAQAKNQQAQTEIGFVQAERNRLLLIAPLDGYVEDVFFGRNSLVPAHRDLIKINPRQPNKIIGFIHENADVPFSLGQEVELASAARPTVRVRGKIIGSNPKMTELPLRLRKFIELRSWGREVFIQLPEANEFFISEKILISL